MKFLLVAINAKYIHSNPAIYSLRAYAGAELGQYVELAEYTINQQMGEILADIYNSKPTHIGFSCYIWNWRMVQDLLVEIPKLLPEVEIWLGGPEVSFDGEEILQQYPHLAGIMVGEGEATFKELLEYYVAEEGRGGRKSPVHIPGLCLPAGCTPMREVMDMSTIPFLYEDLKPFENKIIYYESSRGCPFRCSYCLSSVEKSVRLRDISVVKRELQFFLDNRVKQVKFVDRTFNCNHEHALAIWQYIKEHDNGVTNFHFEISADILREDEIILLNSLRPGLAQLEIGVQSVNPDTLQAIRRVMNVEKLGEKVAAIHQGKNVHQHLDLIAGLPYEDYDSFRESFNRVYEMAPEQLQLGFLKVLKGSEMWQRAREYGICYQSQPPYEVLYTKWLSYEEVLRLKQVEEMVELYYNSGQFTHTLAVLEGVFASPFAMFEALADFYEREGYFVNVPARAYRYQVLLAFAREVDCEREEMYRELLTYDMYLRENLKSRPDFTGDLAEHKEFIREFYQKEEANPKYLPHYKEYDWKQMSKMTHLEPFRYPVWDVAAMAAARSEELQDGEALAECAGGSGIENREPVRAPYTYVLFDYQRRNPLNYEAAIRVV